MKFTSFILLIAMTLTSSVVMAQSIEEAQEAYNAGVTAKGEDNIEEAINQFESCIEMAQAVYDEDEDETAEGLLETVKGVVPSLYFQLGYNQFKNGEAAKGLANLYAAKDLALDYGDGATEAKTIKVIPQIHYKIGASKFKAGEFDAAIAEFDKALVVNPEFVSAYYLKTAVYKKQDKADLLKETVDKGIEVAIAKGDAKHEAKLKKSAKGYFLKKGNAAKGASKFDEAISNLNLALEYAPTDVTSLYLLSATYLAKGNTAEAITAAEKAIANEKGGDEAKAKIYMVIAEAQTKDGDVGAACASYKKAAFGQYTELANYKIVNELKCE